jgi:hypothetical protein
VWAVNNPHFNKPTGVNMKQSAFPISGSQYRHTEGMTLRDYFAAKAMQAIITNHKLEDCDDFVIAANAYQLADFMLKARGE